jgi:hypothetical protein
VKSHSGERSKNRACPEGEVNVVSTDDVMRLYLCREDAVAK